MKKTFFAFFALLAFCFSSQAQTKEAVQPKKEVKTTTQKTVTKVTPTTTTTKLVEPVKTTAVAKTKSDGTPDMRFKENKEKVKEVPKKKDGTPDMRYKQNKKN